ncbi:MAG: hypothetical protein MI919_07190, partial [Holophagales bacterium]|nr:hypothetical protein [Holophagales bacterium]
RWPHSSDAFDGDPFVAPEGQRLFFMSSRGGSVLHPTRPDERPKADIWVSERLADGTWGPPDHLAPPVSSPAIEGHASITSDGTLYFFSGREGGLGGHDIYRSVRARGGFAEPENLGAPINSEAGDGHPFISSDERYLVFYSHRLGGFGSCDLYISLRDGDRWTEPQNLGPGVNTPDCEMTPHVAPGGSELIFARIHADGSRDLYRADFSLERWASRALAGRAERFEEGRISDGDRFAIAFTPDGETAYMTERSLAEGRRAFDIVRTDLVGGEWTPPEAVAFGSPDRDADPFVSPDGSLLLFMSTRPVRPGEPSTGDYDLWQVRKLDDGTWGQAEHLGAGVNTPDAWEGFPTVTEIGTFMVPHRILYFFSEREEGLGESDIYRSVAVDGRFGEASHLGPPVSSPHWDGLPYVGPDDSFLIFASDRPGGFGKLDLYVSYPEGDSSWSVPENLGPGVNTAEDELFPHLGPDGSRLFFSRFHEGGERHIYSIATEPLGLRLELSGHYDLKHSNPDWHPDGSHIVLDSNRAGNYEIFLLRRDDLALHNLTRHPAKDRHPAFSPGGEWIAFDSDRAGSIDVWLIRTDGTGLRRLTRDPGAEIRPEWSPDGQRLVFSSNRSGNWEVYVIGHDGSSEVNISRDPGFDVAYSWSRDGGRIAFESDRAGNGSRDIYSMRPDGSDPRPVAVSPGVDRWPDWSPDGKRIAFCSDRGDTGTWDLFVADRDGGPAVGVFASNGIDWAPKWSPDGKSLLFASRHGRERHLYLLSLKDLRLERLTPGAEVSPRKEP